MLKTVYPTKIDMYNKRPRIDLGKQINWWKKKSVSEDRGGSFDLKLYASLIDIKERIG